MSGSGNDNSVVDNTSPSRSLKPPETPEGVGLAPAPTTLTSTFVADYGHNILHGTIVARACEGDRSREAGLPLDNMAVPGAGIRHEQNTTHLERVKLAEPSALNVSSLLFEAALDDKESIGDSARCFIPRRQLEDICHFGAVLSEIRAFANDDAQATSCAEYVCGPKGKESYNHFSSSRKIFATLALIEKVQLIFEFQKAGIRDKHLPLCIDRQDRKIHWFSDGAETISLEVFKNVRNPWALLAFYDRQWSVHIPYIARRPEPEKACEYKIHNSTIMPWTEFPKKVEKGGYGDVRRVLIHPDHHGFSANYQAFALKTFYRSNELSKIDFQREIRAFRKMPAVPHLVELCATFESDGVYRLLFPWANGGSLKSLWTHNNLPTALFCKQEDINPTVFMHWLATQAHGLMSGLKTIHQLPEPGPGEVVDGKRYGIHGDLKPENILHFSQEIDRHQFGTLKIADFGIVEFHSLATRTSLNQEWSGPASPTYRAPEHDWDIEEKMSRKVDIWSMGCVFSEMLTWALLGGDAVESYREARLNDRARLGDPDTWPEDNFFCRTKEGVHEQYATRIVKPSVSEWLDNLVHGSSSPYQPDEATFCKEFLQFVQKAMLAPARDDRASSEGVIKFIEPKLNISQSSSYWAFSLYEGLPDIPDSSSANT